MKPICDKCSSPQSRYIARLIKSPLAPFLLLLLLSIIFWWELVFASKTTFAFGFARRYYPERYYIVQTLLSGDIPLWNPHAYLGYPVFADSGSGLFYPLNLFLLIPLNFPFMVSMFSLLHFFLAAALTYVLGRECGMNKAGALVAAIVYAFGFYTVAQAPGLDVLVALSLFPGVIFFYLRFMRDRSLLNAGLSATALGMLMLGSHVQFSLYTVLALFAYLVSRLIALLKNRRFGEILPLIGGFAFISLTGAAIAAILGVPFLEMTRDGGIRIGGLSWEAVTLGSVHPLSLIGIFIPKVFDNRYGFGNFYWGLLPLILVVFALLNQRYRVASAFLLGVTILGFMLVLGSHTPLYKLVYKIPVLNSTREPWRWGMYVNLAVALLAGYGTSSILFLSMDRVRVNKSKAQVIIALGTMGAWLITALIVFQGERIFSFAQDVSQLVFDREWEVLDLLAKGEFDIGSKLVTFSILATAIGVLFGLLAFATIPGQLFSSLAIIFVFSNLFIFRLDAQPLRDSSYFTEPSGPVSFLKAKEMDGTLYRIFPANVNRAATDATVHFYISEFQSVYSISSVAGWTGPPDSLRYKRLLALIEKESISGNDYYLDLKIAGLMNAKYIISSEPLSLSGLQQVYREQGTLLTHNLRQGEYRVFIYENEQFMPRAFMVFSSEYISEPEAVLAKMTSTDFKPQDTVVLEGSTAPILNSLPTDVTEYQVETLKYKPQQIRLSVSSPKEGYLILTDRFYPGWKASVDGQEAVIWRANYLFKAVYLEPGHHIVEFTYDPTSLKLGALVSLIGLASLVATLAVGRFRLIDRWKAR